MATESFYNESGTSPPTLAWHYTTMPRFESIQSTGRINRATALVEKGERAAAWFTTSNNFEATALLGNGSRTLTLEEQCGFYTAVRIGVKVNRLDSYKTWKRNSKCSRRMQEALERAAIKAVSNPNRDWHISFTPISWVGWVCVEYSADGHNWVPMVEVQS